MSKWFQRVAAKAAAATGSSWAFLTAISIILVWAITGPVFGFSDTWQLIINTGTTIVTFLMVFLIQNSQNRDTKALHLKLDEIIHVIGPAHNQLIGAENLPQEQLGEILEVYNKLAQRRHQEGDIDLEDVIARATDSDEEHKKDGKGPAAKSVPVSPGGGA